MDYSVVFLDSSQLSSADGAYCELLIDSSSDLDSLPTTENVKGFGNKARAGSIAVCLSPASVYVLSNAGVWTKFMEASES